jgi:hypothetical protein
VRLISLAVQTVGGDGRCAQCCAFRLHSTVLRNCHVGKSRSWRGFGPPAQVVANVEGPRTRCSTTNRSFVYSFTYVYRPTSPWVLRCLPTRPRTGCIKPRSSNHPSATHTSSRNDAFGRKGTAQGAIAGTRNKAQLLTRLCEQRQLFARSERVKGKLLEVHN